MSERVQSWRSDEALPLLPPLEQLQQLLVVLQALKS